jgi:hypothetical protein
MDKLDSTTLTEVIDRLLDYSMDGRFTQPQRSRFLVLAKRLRGALLNLLSARFTQGTQALNDANAELAAVNTTLKQKAQSLANAAQVLGDVATLVGSLDTLLGTAASFL